MVLCRHPPLQAARAAAFPSRTNAQLRDLPLTAPVPLCIIRAPARRARRLGDTMEVEET